MRHHPDVGFVSHGIHDLGVCWAPGSSQTGSVLRVCWGERCKKPSPSLPPGLANAAATHLHALCAAVNLAPYESGSVVGGSISEHVGHAIRQQAGNSDDLHPAASVVALSCVLQDRLWQMAGAPRPADDANMIVQAVIVASLRGMWMTAAQSAGWLVAASGAFLQPGDGALRLGAAQPGRRAAAGRADLRAACSSAADWLALRKLERLNGPWTRPSPLSWMVRRLKDAVWLPACSDVAAVSSDAQGAREAAGDAWAEAANRAQRVAQALQQSRSGRDPWHPAEVGYDGVTLSTPKGNASLDMSALSPYRLYGDDLMGQRAHRRLRGLRRYAAGCEAWFAAADGSARPQEPGPGAGVV